MVQLRAVVLFGHADLVGTAGIENPVVVNKNQGLTYVSASEVITEVALNAQATTLRHSICITVNLASVGLEDFPISAGECYIVDQSVMAGRTTLV